jgi:hypothetical protein
MIGTPVEPWTWSKRRWWVTVGSLVLMQVGLIWWLGEGSVSDAPISARFPRIVVPAERATLLAGLSDPTLFVLPNRHGFSGPVWLQPSRLEQPSLEWTEPEHWLTQNVTRLGGSFHDFVRTNMIRDFLAVEHAEPEDLFNGVPPPPPVPSTARIEGELAARRMVLPLVLKSWPATDIVLTNSEVAMGVTADGMVFSAKLLKGCGSKDADGAAVDLARRARFEPVPARLAQQGPGGLTWGTLIIRWNTIAPPSTNAAAGNP